MPSKRPYTKRKRVYRKKKRTKRNELYLTNSTGALPGLNNGHIVKMPYYNIKQLTVGSFGLHELQVLRLNGIYDPDTSTGGAQPMSHDEFATFYENYQVIGAKAVTTFRWSSTAANAAVTCFAWPDDDTTAPPTIATKRERYPGKVKTLLPDLTETVSITNYFSAKKFFAAKDVADEHQLKAPFTGDPFHQAYLVTGVQDPWEVGAISPVAVETKITYIVRLLDPKPIFSS